MVERFYFIDGESRQKAFEIRHKVFVEEQKVARDEEFDAFDEASVHYLAKDVGGSPVGTARWRFTDKGIKLERFAVLHQHRGGGVGKALMGAILNDLPPKQQVYLHAQVGVIPFYRQFGFLEDGDVFMECDIEHLAMSRTSTNADKLTLQKTIEAVKEFHDAFGIQVAHQPKARVEDRIIDLRYNLMKEENDEYLEAARSGDLVEIADALGDMLYILNGTIITHGLQEKIGPVFEEIQRSNMSKLDENGKPIYREDGKVLKSALYFKPNISRILGE